MIQFKNIILVFIIFSGIYSLNLTLTDYHDPQANHILDAEIIENTLIISAMAQGIEFYDISNGGFLNHIDHFTLGHGVKANCVEAIHDHAYFTSKNGLYVVNISNPSNPQSLGSVNGTSGMILENLDAEGQLLAVAAHEDGVLLYDISNPQSLNYLSTINCENAWGVRLENNYAFIADENKIKIYNITNSQNPNFINDDRQALYYARAIQEPTETINGDALRCTYDDKGNCLEVNPCYGDYRIDKDDQCLTKIEHRAWSSPIFVSNIYNEQ